MEKDALVMLDVGDTDLYVAINDGSILSKEQQFQGLIQLSKTVSWLHQNGISHNDLKLENVLVTNEKKKFVIADFDSIYSSSCSWYGGRLTVGCSPPDRFIGIWKKPGLADAFQLGLIGAQIDDKPVWNQWETYVQAKYECVFTSPVWKQCNSQEPRAMFRRFVAAMQVALLSPFAKNTDHLWNGELPTTKPEESDCQKIRRGIFCTFTLMTDVECRLPVDEAMKYLTCDWGELQGHLEKDVVRTYWKYAERSAKTNWLGDLEVDLETYDNGASEPIRPWHKPQWKRQLELSEAVAAAKEKATGAANGVYRRQLAAAEGHESVQSALKTMMIFDLMGGFWQYLKRSSDSEGLQEGTSETDRRVAVEIKDVDMSIWNKVLKNLPDNAKAAVFAKQLPNSGGGRHSDSGGGSDHDAGRDSGKPSEDGSNKASASGGGGNN
eukprot:GHVS01073072.1.p1 GENE.GHVS01073072.1~~GHVS01073072.1.p1  ORF type:complete len:438 (-),score=61.16 GHVS01073072.1:365-1678(-)